MEFADADAAAQTAPYPTRESERLRVE